MTIHYSLMVYIVPLSAAKPKSLCTLLNFACVCVCVYVWLSRNVWCCFVRTTACIFRLLLSSIEHTSAHPHNHTRRVKCAMKSNVWTCKRNLVEHITYIILNSKLMEAKWWNAFDIIVMLSMLCVCVFWAVWETWRKHKHKIPRKISSCRGEKFVIIEGRETCNEKKNSQMQARLKFGRMDALGLHHN